MTVIAWDGKTLAADKRMTMGCHVNTTTKLFRAGGYILGFTGSAKRVGAFIAWLEGGAQPSAYPVEPDEDQSHALAIRADGSVWKFEGTPYPIRIEDGCAAAGSGRDYARASMHLGKSAAEAVAIACLFDENCGNGINTLSLTAGRLDGKPEMLGDDGLIHGDIAQKPQTPTTGMSAVFGNWPMKMSDADFLRATADD